MPSNKYNILTNSHAAPRVMRGLPWLQGCLSEPEVENASTADRELFPAAQEKRQKAQADQQEKERWALVKRDTNSSAIYRTFFT